MEELEARLREERGGTEEQDKLGRRRRRKNRFIVISKLPVFIKYKKSDAGVVPGLLGGGERGFFILKNCVSCGK